MAFRKVVCTTLLVFLFLIIKISALNLKDITFSDKGKQIQTGKVSSLNFKEVTNLKEPLQIQTTDDSTGIIKKNNMVKLYELPFDSLEKLFKDSSIVSSDIIERIEYFSERSLGTPYVLSSLGEGSFGQYDKDPIVDLSRVDCMTFCEQILALSISYNYDEFIYTLQKIRYHSETVSIKNRNHFFIADWLPSNNWLIEDVTRDVGGELCRQMTKTVNRYQLLLSFGCKDSINVLKEQTLTQLFIPKEYLFEISSNLKNGDIVCIISKKRGIFASHLGFIIKTKDSGLFFRNASKFVRKVIDEPYHRLAYRLMRQKYAAGISVFRTKVNLTLE